MRRFERVRYVVLFLAAVTIAAGATLMAHGLNGTWSLVSKGGPHGEMHFEVAFTQGEGTALTARLSLMDSVIEMKGEAKDGSFNVKGENKGNHFEMSGTLKSDGTLSGVLSADQGDLTWTGTLVK